MSPDLFRAEQEALKSLMEWLEQADRCRVLYERAHMTLPEPLKRVLGVNGSGGQREASHIAPPEPPPRPPEADTDWVWIDAKSVSPANLVLAILRSAKAPMQAGDIIEKVTEILPEVPRGTIHNVGTRLDGETIRRTNAGWELLAPEKAGVVFGEWFWAPASILSKQELAAHRRQAILYVLSFFPTGLQTVQILGELLKCKWIKAPVNKFLIKEDMEKLLLNEKVKRRGNSKKWEAIQAEEEAVT